MPDVASAAVAAGATVIVAIIGVLGAKRLGIGVSQEKLVATLKDLLEAQTQKITLLEEASIVDKQRIASLEKRVDELEQLTIRQAQIIDSLTRQERNTSGGR
jgi:flagellar motility protein MotE (MotC chaperone)